VLPTNAFVPRDTSALGLLIHAAVGSAWPLMLAGLLALTAARVDDTVAIAVEVLGRQALLDDQTRFHDAS